MPKGALMRAFDARSTWPSNSTAAQPHFDSHDFLRLSFDQLGDDPGAPGLEPGRFRIRLVESDFAQLGIEADVVPICCDTGDQVIFV